MFGWINDLISQTKYRLRLAKEINPQSFRIMAKEISELADACSLVCQPENDLLKRVEQIKIEMEQLTELTKQPQFKKLSTERKLELRKSLRQSREQILEMMQMAPSPTKLLQ
ncbi:hypothetical protein [Maridesulfovibrio frigidus]|uniref:hypothetical protein n=1 Tax=Maridesulfovibrio frigidus TaxID=340956 RepID=UPI0004E125E5|nr:hypothetical protein [Maridesulfovibrio frigidus]